MLRHGGGWQQHRPFCPRVRRSDAARRGRGGRNVFDPRRGPRAPRLRARNIAAPAASEGHMMGDTPARAP
ncbi:conserved hypothetical protein [Frankia alni ACN14a]|uniref:Uncharacterized protein n=1 Tax=Frankia alni (strain DSM 45986 / CECT 9034 / ACN14a) TaxID=326424 RepID=Q0RD50_FRAAA|nr:conserved hypothetical protein [Frankia alni ACN14a]